MITLVWFFGGVLVVAMAAYMAGWRNGFYAGLDDAGVLHGEEADDFLARMEDAENEAFRRDG